MNQSEFDDQTRRLSQLAQHHKTAAAFIRGMKGLIAALAADIRMGLSRRLARARLLAIKALLAGSKVAVQLDLYDQYQKAIDRLKGEKDNGQAS